MWVRKRIDIRWSDLLFALRAVVWPGKRICFPDWATDSLACLSVRSGLDLFLTASAFPPGSEVLVSAITIPDMVRVIEQHGLVAVPVDLEPSTLEVNLESVKLAITNKTCAVVVAHLFGAIPPLDAVAELANDTGLKIFEDCAQAFDGNHYQGHPSSDVVAFSFGPIKTATALGGGLMLVRDEQVRLRMSELQSQYPVQSTTDFAKRAGKYSWLKFVGGRWVFSMLARIVRVTGGDIDAVLSSSVRNFGGGDLLEKLRHQPCRALLAMMSLRLNQFEKERQRRRSELGRLLSQHVSPAAQVGAGSEHHSFWVSVVQSDTPDELVSELRSHGFDASTMSQLSVLMPGDARRREVPAVAERLLPRLVFLPHYPEMPRSEVLRMASVIVSFDQPKVVEAVTTRQTSKQGDSKVLKHV